ncbi:MAG TPA: PA14 domain-containing protein, partial [Verrucomicrobiae bacterium]|nr:PA14 domain-containing protein [Verrucomicrobiae bacterium]
ATLVDQPQDIKAHMRPFDKEIHFTGWYDNHHAGGPEVWRQNLYRSPTNYYNRTTNRAEIVYWGEEGAISTPPRLAEIKAALDATPNKGWDGQMYLDWYRQFDNFLTRKNLRSAFRDVEAFTTSMGAVSLYHQGRKIETMRMTDVADGYAVNGWEAESVENHSGIVDDWRNPKGDPAIMAYYNQPLYIAVKARSQFAAIPGEVVADFYAINEKNIHGPHTLKISVRDPQGHTVFTNEVPVTLTGGEVYGELLASDVKVPIAGAVGMFRIEARLCNEANTEVTTGHDEVLAVDWKSQKIGGHGATWESQPRVRDFLDKEKGVKAEPYGDELGRLDWVVVTRPAHEGEPVEIPAERFQSLTATFCSDDGFQNKIHQRPERTVDFFVADGAVPDAQVSVMENYGVLWEGTILPPASGFYTFATDSTDGVRLWVDGKLLFDDYYTRDNTINRGRLTLEAGKAVAVRLEYWHRKGAARCKLLWAPPETGGPDLQKLVDRVRNDGTTLIILDDAETWMNVITNNTAVTYGGLFQIGTAWLGGLHFVREHPLFKDLPVNVAMDWPYQAVVRNGKTRSGLLLEGEELVAGCWHCYPMNLGTAVGIIPCGKGKIIVNTLDIASQLDSTDTSAEVARKLLCNFVGWAGR